jgi:LAO/AO transport system kinase
MELAQRLIDGDVRAVARAISLVEEGLPAGEELLRTVFASTGGATVLGVTGSPGAGKSSLVDRLIARYRGEGKKVGVVAIDPSSAYSGGAILGDRVRMQDHSKDPGVFIRSMATRGHLGGLARATNDAVDLLDAAGYDPLIIETVGVGQDEIDVVRAADAVSVVLVPGMGDDIQAIKAGILEIADLFVINKADRPGADRLAADLDYMLSLSSATDARRPEIFQTVALDERGIPELIEGIARFCAGPSRRRGERRRERAEARFLALLAERVTARVLDRALPDGGLEGVAVEIAERRTDPYTAVERVLARVAVGG